MRTWIAIVGACVLTACLLTACLGASASAELDPSSVNVKGRGPDGARLSSVDVTVSGFLRDVDELDLDADWRVKIGDYAEVNPAGLVVPAASGKKLRFEAEPVSGVFRLDLTVGPERKRRFRLIARNVPIGALVQENDDAESSSLLVELEIAGVPFSARLDQRVKNDRKAKWTKKSAVFVDLHGRVFRCAPRRP